MYEPSSKITVFAKLKKTGYRFSELSLYIVLHFM